MRLNCGKILLDLLLSRWILVLLLGTFAVRVGAQTIDVYQEIELQANVISESSGISLIDGAFWTFNDSGGDPVLYQIDTLTGSVLNQTLLVNAQNIDWEAMAFSDDEVFVGDIGNNQGSRQDLKVYRFPREELGNAEVQVDSVLFHYPEQTDFTPTSLQTNFDAEALLFHDGTLFLFTKNWSNLQTTVYGIPLDQPEVAAQLISTIQVDGWITDATYDPFGDQVGLCGYTFEELFFYSIPSANWEGDDHVKLVFGIDGGFQVEGLAHSYNGHFHFSREGENGVIPKWFIAEVEFTSSVFRLHQEFYCTSGVEVIKFTRAGD
ncbi:MAG: hypothetical protein HRT74_04610 [Flavobacteriales bacterium]|nr:hypothetical protein [Flavobacteriales bacterium]